MDTGNPDSDEGSGSDPMTVSPPDHIANLQLLLDAADEIDRERWVLFGLLKTVCRLVAVERMSLLQRGTRVFASERHRLARLHPSCTLARFW